MKPGIVTLISAVLTLIWLPAQAAITLNFEWDSVSNVTTASWNGTWDVDSSSTWSGSSVLSSTSGFYAIEISFSRAGGVFGDGISGTPFPWGISRNDWVMSPGSDSFGFDQNYVYGPNDFTNSTMITGSISRTGSLTDLGFANNSGGLSGTLSGGGGTVNWSTSAVIPEPSAYAALAGFLALGIAACRRRVRR